LSPISAAGKGGPDGQLRGRDEVSKSGIASLVSQRQDAGGIGGGGAAFSAGDPSLRSRILGPSARSDRLASADDQHFGQIDDGSVDPIVLARAAYWRGRASEAAGQRRQ
jgi:hypothetical protein